MAKSKRELLGKTGALKNLSENIGKGRVEQIKENLIIKAELKSLIPPLSADEYKQLEENLIFEGCRDPLVVWQKGDKYILVDGHNRYTICSQHNIEFKVETKEFTSLDRVKDWMINNQLGKRNLSEVAKSYLRGEQYANEKKSRGGDRKSKVQNEPLKSESTADVLADEHKVSPSTIKRDAQYAEALNKFVGKDQELKWKILNKDVDIPKKLLLDVADQGDKAIKEAKQSLLTGGTLKASKVKKPTAERKDQSEEDKLIKEIFADLKQATKGKDLGVFELIRRKIGELEEKVSKKTEEQKQP